MKTTSHSVWIVLFLTMVALIPAQAKDEVRLSSPSKVESSKNKEREKLFTPWMPFQKLHLKEDEMRAKGQQIIYFEYDSERGQSRAIFLSNLKLNGPVTHYSFSSEDSMQEMLNSQIKSGLQPAFVVRHSSGAYTMLFVTPQDIDAVRKELAVLGIGEPKLKK